MNNAFIIILSVVLMTMLGSLGAVCFKKTSVSGGEQGGSIFLLLKDKWFYLGALLYVSGAVFNIIALRFLDYSVVLPLSSITYLWTIFFSYKFFKEEINKYKIIAICFIIFGVVMLMLGNQSQLY